MNPPGKEEDEKDSSTLGEGGDTGELVPGKSLVFAAMELLVFILVRHLPQLNARVSESPNRAPPQAQRLPPEGARLVAHTVSILAELPSLCSPASLYTHTTKIPANPLIQGELFRLQLGDSEAECDAYFYLVIHHPRPSLSFTLCLTQTGILQHSNMSPAR